MPKFVVTHQCIPASSLLDEDAISLQAHCEDLDAVGERLGQAGRMPAGALAFVDARATQENGGRTIVDIDVLVEAESPQEAGLIEIEDSVLLEAAQSLGENLCLSGSWKVLPSEPFDSFVIRSIDVEDEFWSNEDGWVDAESATIFTPLQHRQLNLPMGGEWLSSAQVDVRLHPFPAR